jgi:hypothetical protein
MASASVGGEDLVEGPSPIKRMMLQAALRKAGITRETFPAWYQDTLGKPFVRLEIADVKPLWDAAYRAVDERRGGQIAQNRQKQAPDAPQSTNPPEVVADDSRAVPQTAGPQ